MVLDYPGGCEESNTDDDGDSEGDSEIDLKKLLSSASQTTEGGGPDLNRQIMTHLRVLQANLQHLKVEQWFPNFLASDPKETFDICPGPKLVKTADLQAHSAARSDAL